MSCTATIELQPAAALSSIDSPHLKKSETTPRAGSLDLNGAQDSDASLDQYASPKTTAPKVRLALLVFQMCAANFLMSLSNAAVTVGLPVIAEDIKLPRSLYLWPSSVYGLTSGAILLLAGSIADIIGPRPVELAGVSLLGVFTLACGFSQSGIQLVIFRALQGIAMAMHLPSSVALIAAAVPPGRARNIGFATLGLSQPLGFSFGLVVVGIMIEKVGWRSGFYLSGSTLLATAAAAFWTLPNVKPDGVTNRKGLWKRLQTEVDWLGGLIASGGLAILSYVLGVLSADLAIIKTPTTASLLALSIVLLGIFPFWMHFREQHMKPALIPNSLWKNIPFASTCLMVLLAWGVMNANELFSSLYFQEVQNRSTLTTSLYLLPNLMSGVFINFTVGFMVDRLPARWLVATSSLLCALSPLAMALVNPAWNYWYLEFWAQILCPFSGDVLFTVGLIIVSDNFPEETQALAGAVFNTVAQFGWSLGVGICQVVALGVMRSGGSNGQGTAFEDAQKGAVLKGYRASFWTMFASMTVCGLVAIIGLRRAGKVGLKRE